MKFLKTEHLLLVIPAGLVVLSGVMMEIRGPYNLGLNIDPEYVSLLNSVNLATLKSSTYFQHPATTLQIIGAIVIFAKWLVGGVFTGWEPLPVAVISEDLSYLRAINMVLVALLALVSYLAARKVYRLSGSMLAAIALQLTPLLYLPCVEALPRVAPELLEVIVGLALILPLAPLIMGPKSASASRDPKLAICAGILLAAGIATKANFFTLGVIIFLFKGNRQKLRFLVACFGSLFLLLLPVATEFSEMARWFINMATHTGHYGQGAAGLPGLAVYLENIGKMFNDEPFVFYFLFYYLVVLVAVFVGARASAGGQLSGVRKALLVGTFAIVVHIAITAKHYNYHYILPAAMVTVLVNACLVHLFRIVPLHRQFKIALIAVGLMIGYEGLRSNYNRMSWYKGWKQEYQQHVADLAAKREGMKDCVMIGYYRSSLPAFALSFGNDLSGQKQQKALSELHPGAISYSIYGGGFRSWSGEPMQPELERVMSEGGCVVLQGETSSVHLVTEFQVEPVAVPEKPMHGAEGLYKLTLKDSSSE